MPSQPPLPPSPHSGLLLSRLLEEIEINVAPTERVALYAKAIARERNTAPRFSIQVGDWSRGKLLAETPYVGEPVLHGTLEDSLRIAGDLISRGLSVRLEHREGAILIWVDDQNFTQR